MVQGNFAPHKPFQCSRLGHQCIQLLPSQALQGIQSGVPSAHVRVGPLLD
jgi:hypothetical protein